MVVPRLGGSVAWVALRQMVLSVYKSAISFLWGGHLIDTCTGSAERCVSAQGLLYEVELLVGVAA
jgi:hypothetical protein